MTVILSIISAVLGGLGIVAAVMSGAGAMRGDLLQRPRDQRYAWGFLTLAVALVTLAVLVRP